MKNDIDQPVRPVILEFRTHFYLKVAVLLKELVQHIRSVTNIQRRISPARWIIGHLNQTRVGKLLGARKSIDSEINRWLQDKHHTNAIGLRPDFYFHLLGLAAGL